jgi:hypothetical protein
MVFMIDGSLEIALSESGVKFTALGLTMPTELSEENWAELGRKLLRTERVVQWWIGDWAHFGDGDSSSTGWRKKGALRKFCDMNGFHYGTVCNWSWVSASVHHSLRGERLDYSFFKELAPLKPKEQKLWLKKAIEENLTVSNLRKAIRIAGGENNALESDGPVIEFGTEYYEHLRAWLSKRPPEFWLPERLKIWQERIAELAGLLPT